MIQTLKTLSGLIREVQKMALLPRFLRPIVSRLLRNKGEDRAADIVLVGGSKSTFSYWSMLSKRTMLARSFFEAWKKLDIHVLVTPTCSLPALPHGGCLSLLIFLYYF